MFSISAYSNPQQNMPFENSPHFRVNKLPFASSFDYYLNPMPVHRRHLILSKWPSTIPESIPFFGKLLCKEEDNRDISISIFIYHPYMLLHPSHPVPYFSAQY
jgi:hypothetical protein